MRRKQCETDCVHQGEEAQQLPSEYFHFVGSTALESAERKPYFSSYLLSNFEWLVIDSAYLLPEPASFHYE
jgi:hypothetical protein